MVACVQQHSWHVPNTDQPLVLQTRLEDTAKGYTDYFTLSQQQDAELQRGAVCSRQHCKAAAPVQGTPRSAQLGNAY